MTHRILIVDDWPHRYERIADEIPRAGFTAEFRRRSGPASVTGDDLAWASMAWLDHDMCQRQFTTIFVPDESRPCPSPVAGGTNKLDLYCGCPTGTDLARRMVASPHRPRVVVHSANNVAGPEMVATLRDAGFRVTHFPATMWGRTDWRKVMGHA